ncbi:YY1-associated factor 2 isoform X3 [Oncorhynchus masou masou]|uniref:YY1-associated factor 2 isoform X3 n=1 Tax=Oncorhynchus masou masou TaxID=90313 RepID=UPI00318371B9
MLCWPRSVFPISDVVVDCCIQVSSFFKRYCRHFTLRKPRPVSQLVAQRVAPQFASPTLLPKKDKKDRTDQEKNDKEPTVKKNNHKKMRPRLKNIDRSSAQHLEVTVGDLTVIITDFKEKTKPPPSSTTTTPPTSTTPSSTVSVSAEHHSGSSSDNNTERGVSRSSSPRGEGFLVGTESH